MTQKELIAIVSENMGIKKKEAKKAVAAVFEAISYSLENFEDIRIGDAGKLMIVDFKQRKYRHPQTKEMIIIPSKRRIRFKASEKLKRKVNE